MSDHHHFDVEVAERVGVNAAILFANFSHWIRKNASEGVNFVDGEYWTFATLKGLKALFPYLTEKQIRSAVEALIDVGYIKKAHHHNDKTNRTTWFSLASEGKCICPTGQMEMPQRANVGFALEGKCNLEDINEDVISTIREPVDNSKVDDEPEFIRPEVQLSIICNRFGIRTHGGDPRLKALVDQGVSPDMMAAACEEAKESGIARPGLGYVVRILETWASKAKAINVKDAEPPKPREFDNWASSNEGIDRKGRELGLTPRPMESYDDFRVRIYAEIRKRKGVND